MNTQTKVAIIAIAAVITLASLAVSQTNFNFETSAADDSKLQLVTSASFLHEFSQNIGKEKINSTLLVPMGINPHDWEPTIRDTEKLEKSDMIIINGLGYETWVDSLDLSNIQGVIVDTSNGISIEHDDEHENEKHDDAHTEEFYEEIADVIEEFEHGHITESQSIEAIEEILHEHEGDGHGHGTGAIEDIENFEQKYEDLYGQNDIQTRGAKLIDNKCMRCHGNGNQRGGFGGMENLVNLSEKYINFDEAEKSLIYKVSQNGSMPTDPRERLNDQELQLFIDYINSLRE